MSGVPGRGGPPPKRSSQRRRTNKPTGGEITTAPGAAEVPPPRANQKWHPIARRWFEALAASGQSAFYEPSDWATAELIAESMSRDLKPQVVGMSETVRTDPESGLSYTVAEPVMAAIPLKGASLAGYLKAFTALLATEGDRRRARLELERAKGGDVDGDVAGVSWLDEARRRESG